LKACFRSILSILGCNLIHLIPYPQASGGLASPVKGSKAVFFNDCVVENFLKRYLPSSNGFNYEKIN